MAATLYTHGMMCACIDCSLRRKSRFQIASGGGGASAKNGRSVKARAVEKDGPAKAPAEQCVAGDGSSKAEERQDVDVDGPAKAPAALGADGDAAALVEEVRAGVKSVVQRLRLKFGLGDRPERRLALYRRLQDLYELDEERLNRIISTAVAQAVGSRSPGRYFCVAVTRMCREEGLSLGDSSW